MIVLQCYRCLVTSMPWNPGHLASRGWSCWDCKSMSHVRILSKGMDGSNWFWHVCFFRPILLCLVRKLFLYFPLELCLNFWLKISPRLIDRRTCYQLRSTEMDARNVINWTVVGQLSWQYLRRSTASLSQWSSSSVYSTIPSRGRSATADTCQNGLTAGY